MDMGGLPQGENDGAYEKFQDAAQHHAQRDRAAAPYL
jgi:hypothetical protein